MDLDYPRALLLVLLVVVNVVVVVTLVTSATALGPFNSGWNGGTGLTTELETAGADVDWVLSTDAYLDADAGETSALVLAPTRPYSDDEVAEMRSFVTRGGRLVVAAESNRSNALLDALGVRPDIDGGLLRDDQHNLGNTSLVVATNVTRDPLTRNVSALALNRGTVLVANGATSVVNTSTLAYIDRNRNGTLDDEEALGSRPVVVVESLGTGQIVAVSDPSVFTNAMLDEAGNRQFLRNLLGNRSHAVVDYSHSPPLAPLTYAFIAVRNSPVLQAGLGLALVGIVLAVGFAGGRLADRFRGIRESSTDPEVAVGRLDGDELTRYLRSRHPEWEAERLERVTKAIIRQRGQGEADD